MTELISIPTALWILLIVAIFVCGGIILYALRTKAYVFAKLSHGLTSFEIEARERSKTQSLE